jgi:hypothetical protein
VIDDWFHPDLTRKSSEELLSQEKSGSNFLVRYSDKFPGKLTLSIIKEAKKEFSHVLIHNCSTGFSLQTSGQPGFFSLKELLRANSNSLRFGTQPQFRSPSVSPPSSYQSIASLSFSPRTSSSTPTVSSYQTVSSFTSPTSPSSSYQSLSGVSGGIGSLQITPLSGAPHPSYASVDSGYSSCLSPLHNSSTSPLGGIQKAQIIDTNLGSPISSNSNKGSSTQQVPLARMASSYVAFDAEEERMSKLVPLASPSTCTSSYHVQN